MERNFLVEESTGLNKCSLCNSKKVLAIAVSWNKSGKISQLNNKKLSMFDRLDKYCSKM